MAPRDESFLDALLATAAFLVALAAIFATMAMLS